MTKLRLIPLLALAALGLSTGSLAEAAAPPSPSVIGGTPVAQGAFPYVAYVYAATGGGEDQVCTGSVIAPTIILTAAHCVFYGGVQLPPTAFGVATGSVNRPATAVANNVVRVQADPYFNPSTFQNDAAILTLSTPTSAPAIPMATTANEALYAPGTVLAYAGWGETVPDDETSAPIQLQTGTVSVLANAACQSAVQYHPGVGLCVGGPAYRPATCHGDSGGPLVAGTPAGPVLVGITSYGSISGCGIAPDYFTRALAVQPWVAAAILLAPAAPPVYVPPFNPPAPPAAALAGDGVSVTFAAPAADYATLPTGFAVSLVGANAAVIATQTLAPTATTAAFPGVQPGTYTVSIVAAYSEGASPAAVSAAVTLNPPSKKTKPKLSGAEVVGYRLGCKNGTWNWPGGASFTVTWLRNGKPIPRQKSTVYSVKKADVGKRLICRVTLHATSGSSASAESKSVLAGVRLKLAKRPKLVGKARVGSALVCATGRWAHTGHLGIKVQWLRNSKLIKSAKRGRYVLVKADSRKQIACKVTVTATGQSAWYRTASRPVS